MTPADDVPLAVLLAQVAGQKLGARDFTAPQDLTDEQLLTAIVLFESMSTEALKLQHDTVSAARARGLAWSQIGGALNVSRQSVQQRFGAGRSGTDQNGASLIGPVSRSNEIDLLNAAGELGWKLQHSRHGEHSVNKTDHRWTVWRGSILSAPRSGPQSQPWQVTAVRFPDVFYVRDDGAL